MNRNTSAVLTILTAALGLSAAQQQDPEFAKLVKEWTTRPEFMSPLVDHLPRAAGVPAPKDILGYHIGSPKKLTRVADIARYYRALAAATPRVRVLPAGSTDEGRECLVVAVSDEANIRDLEIYKSYLTKLADPRAINEAQVQDILSKAKPVYMLTGGLHSAETGPPEMLMELAYRLAVEETPLFDQIRRNAIVMIAAPLEPDGRDRYVDWYYGHLISQEKETDRGPSPPYWGKYIYHDNNRDINYSQVTMRNWLKFYLEWHPPIVHDLHESVPFLYTFSGQAPQNPTLDPILYAELPWFSNFEMTKMIGYGMPGVWTHAFVDMWSPGYLGFMSSNHNGLLRMYETFGNGGANTLKRNLSSPDIGSGPRRDQTTREWYRPLPPYKEVVWSMRNNTNYMETAVLSALELASSFPRTVVENFYKKSRNSIEAGKSDPPHAYILPAGQRDMTRVAFIVNTLRLQGIEAGRAVSEVKLKDGTYPAGSVIIKRDQPYGRLAKILLEKQQFPDPSLRTYDDTGWTMGLMSHATVKETADKTVLEVPVEPIATFNVTGSVSGSGPLLAVIDNGANALATLRYRLRNVPIDAVERAFQSAGTDVPAGSFVAPASAELKGQIEKLGLRATALAAAPDVPKHRVDLPRLALYSTWGDTQETGWVRYGFDQFEIAYDLIYKERVRQGKLRASYDVIVIPSHGGGSAKSLVFDVEPKGAPVAYKKEAGFPSLGQYGESDDITGGMGLAGAQELQNFVDEGGILITLGGSSYFPVEFGLTRRVESSRAGSQFYAPGPIVEAEIVKPAHPVFYGYTEKAVPVRYANGPLLRVAEDDNKWVLMRFPGTEKSVLSGLMRGVADTRNRPAVLDVPVGQGHVVLFATNPCYRWQNLGEFRMLANAILHFNDYPKPASEPAASGGR